MRRNSIQGFREAEHLPLTDASGLERSCKRAFRDGMRIAAPGRGIERIEARFHGNGFSPHRHDTYALGLTLHGIQTFRYRGAERFSSPGNVIVLHPDEVHDGAAGTDDGLIYRMIYLPPELIAAVGDFRSALPFVPEPVITDAELSAALAGILADFDTEPQELAIDEAMVRIADRLAAQAKAPLRTVKNVSRLAVLRARDFLQSHSAETVRSEMLETITGLDRYELARQFRVLLGTSPHRYLIMRRLEQAKMAVMAGDSLADAAVGAGFADQAHFTRHFHKAFGMTPGKWSAMRDRRS